MSGKKAPAGVNYVYLAPLALLSFEKDGCQASKASTTILNLFGSR